MSDKKTRRRERRMQPQAPGTAPGTLAAHGEALPTEIRFLKYDPQTATGPESATVAELPTVPGGVLWVDVVGTRDVEKLRQLGERFELHPLVLEDIVNFDQRPKLEAYGRDLFLVARMFTRLGDQGPYENEQLSILVRKGLVITFQERPGDCFQRVRERLQSPARRLRQSGADYLAYALLDAVIDGYQPVMDSFEDRLEVIEDRLLDDPQENDLQGLHTLRRELIALRRHLAPVREVVSGLMRDSEAAEILTDETRLFLRDCYDHVIRTIDQVDSFRELCASLMDLYISTVSNRTNDVMKVLTMIATVFIPLSFLVGLYGMNFDTSSPWNMPELSTRYGYPVLIFSMALVAGSLLAYFRKKGWL